MIPTYVSPCIHSAHFPSFAKRTLVTCTPHLPVYLLLRYHTLFSIIPVVSDYCNLRNPSSAFITLGQSILLSILITISASHKVHLKARMQQVRQTRGGGEDVQLVVTRPRSTPN